MIKILLKHTIYDYCIDILFDKIKENFILNEHITIPKVDDFYSKISNKDNNICFYNCLIKEIDKMYGQGISTVYRIRLKFENSTFGSNAKYVAFNSSLYNNDWFF